MVAQEHIFSLTLVKVKTVISLNLVKVKLWQKKSQYYVTNFDL